MSKITVDEDDVLFFFRRYVGIKLHFTNERYTYNQTYLDEKLNRYSMNERHDIQFFIKIANEMNSERELYFNKLITMFKNKPESYIRDIVSHELELKTIKRMSVIENLDDVIERDYESIIKYARNTNMRFCRIVNFDNDRPLMLRKRLVSDEFVTLLHLYYPFLDQPTINLVFDKRRLALKKYHKFVPNNKHIDEILKECSRRLTES